MCIRDRCGRGPPFPTASMRRCSTASGSRRSCSCLLYTSPSPRDRQKSRMPSSALIIRQPPRSTPLYSSAASDVYKRQVRTRAAFPDGVNAPVQYGQRITAFVLLSLIHISEPTRQAEISYAVFCFNNTATTEIYTSLFVGSVRCV